MGFRWVYLLPENWTNGIMEALAPTEGLAAQQRKGNLPLVPWGRRGIVV